jgi:hypothetical protein
LALIWISFVIDQQKFSNYLNYFMLSPILRPSDMKPCQRLTFLRTVFLLFTASAAPVSAQSGYYNITQLPIANAMQPSINNSGEIVWALNGDGGIFSSVRGKLADSGLFPHLANSGEVVYAGWFGGPGWDLVSTTRGRLTYGGIIDVNRSTFDVNAQGEAVYTAMDTNNFLQIFSTVRGQITFGAGTHLNPCINDLGEIIWSQYVGGPAELDSSARGIIPGLYPWPLALNNLGEFCYSGDLTGPPGNYSSPHIFSSSHGVVINNPNQFQWNGSINDAGTIVWEAPDASGSSTWYLYEAEWVSMDTNPPVITRITTMPDPLWPPNNRLVQVTLTVEATDDYDPAPVSSIVQVISNGRQNPSDWAITGPLTVELRARPDRVYTIVVECRDASGNVSSKSTTVKVAHDIRRRHWNHRENFRDHSPFPD